MNTKLLFGDGGTRLELVRAILIYQNGAGQALASVNPVKDGQVLPGTALDSASLSNLVAELTSGQESPQRCVLPERVLYSDASLLVWWCPTRIRPIYFRSGKPALDEISGKSVVHPSVVFVARPQSLSVWALQEDTRPDAETPLCVAPYFNLYEAGNMCNGNIRLPESLRPSSNNLKGWETAFFETNFTHTNRQGKALTLFEGGHDALWKTMIEEPVFPADSLVPTNKTLGAVLAKGGVL